MEEENSEVLDTKIMRYNKTRNKNQEGFKKCK